MTEFFHSKFNTIPNTNIDLTLETYYDSCGVNRINLKDFEWADLHYEDIITIEREIFFENVYGCWRGVKEGDIVVDIGANVGPFVKSIIHRNPQKVYCVEPSTKLVKTISENFPNNDNIVLVNKAIVGDSTDIVHIFLGRIVQEGDDRFEEITFHQFLEDYSIEKIDFLKIDCEGGEYDIFQEENMEFLLNNVEFMAVEIHLNHLNCREKFKNFRDKYLVQFKDYKVMSCTRQQISWGNSIDLKDQIFDNNFIDSYNCEFMIYVWN